MSNSLICFIVCLAALIALMLFGKHDEDFGTLEWMLGIGASVAFCNIEDRP
jgi:hypothetical protein